MRFSPSFTVRLENSTPIVCCECSLTAQDEINKEDGIREMTSSQELCVNWWSRHVFPVPASPAVLRDELPASLHAQHATHR